MARSQRQVDAPLGIVTTIVDEERSLLPFFQFNRIPSASTDEESVDTMVKSDAEVILGKLFLTSLWIMPGTSM